MRPDFRRKLYPELLKLLGSANVSQIRVGIIKYKDTKCNFDFSQNKKNEITFVKTSH